MINQVHHPSKCPPIVTSLKFCRYHRSGAEMEKEVYGKADTREDYVANINRLVAAFKVLHLLEKS